MANAKPVKEAEPIKRRLVHMGTQIQTQFGVVEPTGDVTPLEPVSLTVFKLSPDSFAEAQMLIRVKSNEFAATLEEPNPEES